MATQLLNVFKCNLCGNMVEVVNAAAGALTCCNQAMELLQEQTADAANEKHVPVVEKIDGGYRVTVGSVAHPMVDDHWIEWIELLADGVAFRRFLNPGDAPEAVFKVEASQVSAREHCNKHGLWKS
jgi:superoxide reductase